MEVRISVSGGDLAVRLARVLDGLIPDGISIRCSAPAVLDVYSNGAEVGTVGALAIIDDVDDNSPSERVETAVSATLSGLQDEIIEVIHRNWPDAPGGGKNLPVPECRVEGGELLVWFANETATVLTLPAIPLTPADG